MTETLATGPAKPGDVFVFPLSFAQQRLWFLDRLEPGSPAYNIPLVVRLHGTLDVEALEASLARVVERHEALRTTFFEQDGDPYQAVADSVAVDLPVVAAASEDEAVRLAAEEVNRPFDLETGPVLRARLLRLAEDDHLLTLTVHHIAADGWSTGILFRDLAELYAAAVEGREPDLPELEIQYPDFAVWQRDWLQGERLDDHLAYWRVRLEGAAAVLELPADRPRPALPSGGGAHVRAVLPANLLTSVKQLGHEEGATLFMTLLAAFSALLGRYSGQDDVLVGTPIANRTRVELEPVVGFFANTLVLRTDLAERPSFRDLLRRVRESTLGAYGHQDLPFEKLVSELNPERHLSHSPVFQVLFALQNVSGSRLELPGLTLSSVELERGSAKWDLALFASEGPQGLRLSVEYSTDLFEGATARRLLGHLRTLLEGAVAAPDVPVAELPLLTVSERAQLQAWNATERVYGTVDRCLHELVEAQAERTPAAAAVVAAGRTLTYAQLNAWANRLAHRLRALGVGRDVPVALCLNRSPELAVAVLAALKAGGAYVPLEPAYPAERLAYMLEESAPPVLLTERALLDRLPEHAAEVLLLDGDDPVAAEPEENPEFSAGPDDLAYVIYTSGSTGRPKGVAMPHRPLVNLLSWQLEAQRPPAAARTLQFAALSFDVAFQEMFSTWVSGGALVLVDETTRRDAEALLRLLDEERVERLFLPFVALQHLAEASAHLDLAPRSLREVFTAGEALQITPAIRALFARLPGSVLHNHYGPTESHVVTALTLDEAPAEWPERPAIGKPIANARIHLLDGHRRQVPIGVPGELYIGGPVLARGYLHRPELTTERFLGDPFDPSPEARIYRTGDLARYLPDGTIDYLGRADDQVKLRGYRVEPGEVEAVLARHPTVREAVAVVREDRAGERRLVAYTVPEDDGALDPGELREFLRATLPEYMIPSAFVLLEALPLSPNGKIDRRALPEPERTVRDELVPPRDDDERRLVAIWQKVLGLDEPIGIRDDFFALGGHSLLAVRLFAEIEKELDVRLPLASVFHGATVEELAAVLGRERQRSAPWSALVPLRPEGTRPPLFLVHGIDGTLLYWRELVAHLDPAQPVYGLQAIGLDGRRHLHTSFEEMAAHYVHELRTFQPDGPYLLAGHCFSGVLAYEIARQLEAQGHRPALLALIDATPYGHRPRPTRVQLERSKFADFRRRDLRGKAAWIARRARGAGIKVTTRAQRTAYDLWTRTRLPLPGLLRDPRAAGQRAMDAYVTPPSGCRVTLFRAAGGGETSSFYRSTFWSRLAQGGVEIRPVAEPGIRHDNIMNEPYVRTLAREFGKALDRAVSEAEAAEPAGREVA